MNPPDASLLSRFARRPRTVPLRRFLFQVHLWCGLAFGLYLVAISLSGSVLVYRSELRQRFDPQPRIVSVTGPRMTMEDLVAVAQVNYPGHEIEVWVDPEDPTHAVTLQLEQGDTRFQQLFDPYTGADLGNALPFGWRATTWLLELHDNLLTGETGRLVNGVGALALTLISVTGLVVWWPGITGWRRALGVDVGRSWHRFTWSLHGAAGVWTFAFLVMWGVTGIYLAYPAPFSAFVDYVEPLDLETFEPRVGDGVLYWLARVHFGRFGGGPTKLLWAVIGLVPVLMFVSGLVMWWARVVRRTKLSGSPRDS